VLTDHAKRDGALKYADVELEGKWELMGRIVQMNNYRSATTLIYGRMN
jgi:hypothetical protein